MRRFAWEILGMPLDAQKWAVSVFYRLDRSVLGLGAATQAPTDGLDRLMMDAVGVDVGALLHPVQLGARLDADPMDEASAFGDQMRQGGLRRKILHQGASEGDVEDLTAAAYSEERHRRRHRLAHQGDLPRIAVPVHSPRGGRTLHAVVAWIHIAAPGEQEAVYAAKLVDGVVQQPWQKTGNAPGRPDRFGVCLFDHIQSPLTGLKALGRDADSWSYAFVVDRKGLPSPRRCKHSTPMSGAPAATPFPPRR
jgi:hypothetical protein